MIPLAGWQGMMAKTANNYDKAHPLSCVLRMRDHEWVRPSPGPPTRD